MEIDADAFLVLQEWDAVIRQDLAGNVPPMDRDVTAWAAQQFFKACQCLVDRDVGEESMRAALGEICPVPRGPRTDYSVDLIFRFLPDLAVIAHRIAPEDGLNRVFENWAHVWPLSSVGIKSVSPVSISSSSPDSFFQNAALRRLYLDRITAAVAKDRLSDPEVRRWLEADLGAYPYLAPLVRDALNQASLPPVSAS